MITSSHQDISDEDIQSVIDVLKSDFLTQGPVTPKFENAVCNYVDVKYGLAVNSGTSALHLACPALELGKNDILWTSSITFVASANCGLYCGAQVDFIDIDPSTGNLSVSKLREKLIKAEEQNLLPKIVVAVHLAGFPCEMEKINALSKQYSFSVIEDASHALGSKYKNSFVGNCDFSDITVFSFHPVKPITTGEGGMAVTNDKQLIDRMRLLSSHGITRDQKQMTHKSDGSWYYQQIALGFNYRMTDIQAALGLSQLDRLDQFLEKRNHIANAYDEEFQSLPLQLPPRSSKIFSSNHLYIVRLKSKALKHNSVFEALIEQGIGVNLHYIPVHLQPYYQKFGFCEGDFPEAELYYQEAISIPIHTKLSVTDIKAITDSVKNTLEI